MHVAICDDNVADRRHLERLLSRESDKRAGTPNILYVDSYGDQEHFLRNPLKYNLIFMDMCSEPGIVEEIIRRLEEMGYHAPLVLYSSKYDYTTIPNLPAYVVHASKPYVPEPLPDFLRLGDANVRGTVVTIQFHQDASLIHIPKNDIMYALPSGEAYRVCLTDGSCARIEEEISMLRQLLTPFHEFRLVQKDCFVNFKYVSSVMPLAIVMQDYREFSISPLQYRELKRLKEELDSQG